MNTKPLEVCGMNIRKQAPARSGSRHATHSLSAARQAPRLTFTVGCYSHCQLLYTLSAATQSLLNHSQNHSINPSFVAPPSSSKNPLKNLSFHSQYSAYSSGFCLEVHNKGSVLLIRSKQQEIILLVQIQRTEGSRWDDQIAPMG